VYDWLLFLHVLGTFGFLLAHGASATVAFQLRRERNRERICALLDLSSSSYGVMYSSLGLLLVSGIITGFLGRWWRYIWIWAALGLLIAIVLLMYALASDYYNKVRKAAGMPYFEGRKERPGIEPATPAEIDALLTSRRPVELMAIGGGGLALILWLMIFKPF
jgi:hypothetical protein